MRYPPILGRLSTLFLLGTGLGRVDFNARLSCLNVILNYGDTSNGRTTRTEPGD